MTGTRACLIVEDLVDTRTWLAGIVQEIFGVTPALAGSLAAARDWRRQHSATPVLALIDIGLPDGSGLDLVNELAGDPRSTIIVTTIFEDDETLLRAFACGAHGFLLKALGSADIADRLRALERGEVAISPSIARRLLGRFRQAQPSAAAELTHRETEVLSMIGRGLTVAEASNVLGIAGETVSTHVKSIYRKLNIASRAEAALEARRRGLA
ncbi:LuxR C-terminal-related transcriptional regulator [Sphingomonas sp. RS2018]